MGRSKLSEEGRSAEEAAAWPWKVEMISGLGKVEAWTADGGE